MWANTLLEHWNTHYRTMLQSYSSTCFPLSLHRVRTSTSVPERIAGKWELYGLVASHALCKYVYQTNSRRCKYKYPAHRARYEIDNSQLGTYNHAYRQTDREIIHGTIRDRS